MLICHELVVSNGAAVLQACHMSDVHATLAMSIVPVSWEIVHWWVPHPVLSITSGFSITITWQWRITTTAVARHSCRTHENCMHAEQIIIIFYIFIFIFCSLYLVLFSIALYRTIVIVYTDNIFLYNYLQQMHQIINLSPLGCFTTARGKSMQKNCEVRGVKTCQSYTVKYRFTKIVPKIHWEGHKGSMVLRSSTARTRKGATPMSRNGATTMSNQALRVTCTGTYSKSTAPLNGCVVSLFIVNTVHHTATCRRWARFHS